MVVIEICFNNIYPIDPEAPECHTLSVWRNTATRKRRVEVGPVGSLLLMPFLLLAAVLYLPVAFAAGYIQNTKTRAFQSELKARGRVMNWSEFVRLFEEGSGTTILEKSSYASFGNLWWTPEDVYEICPHHPLDLVALNDPAFLSFAEWFRERYTNPDTGKALLVGPSPKGEFHALFSRLKSAESPERWIEVVPPEVVKKGRYRI